MQKQHYSIPQTEINSVLFCINLRQLLAHCLQHVIEPTVAPSWMQVDAKDQHKSDYADIFLNGGYGLWYSWYCANQVSKATLDMKQFAHVEILAIGNAKNAQTVSGRLLCAP